MMNFNSMQLDPTIKITDGLQIIFSFSDDDDHSLEDGLDRRRKKTGRPSSVNSPTTIPSNASTYFIQVSSPRVGSLIRD